MTECGVPVVRCSRSACRLLRSDPWCTSAELHRAVWPRQCEAGASGAEQGEDSEEDGGRRADGEGVL